MRALIIWILSLVLVGATLDVCYGADTMPPDAIVHDYVDWFHQNVRPEIAAKAKEIIPPLLKYTRVYDVNPLEVACIFSLESSWRNFEGAAGERGPGQVMPGKFANQFDIETIDGQIEASVARWAMAWEKCETLHGAIAHYASGSCTSRTERTKRKVEYRVKYIQRMKKKFEGS